MYCYLVKDQSGFTHSIDNLVIEYSLMCSTGVAVSFMQGFKECSEQYWENLDLKSCTRYNFFKNHIHPDKGFFVMIGKYAVFQTGFKKNELLPVMRIEVNPNKHHETDAFKKLLAFIEENTTDGYIIRYDYAIDIPEEVGNVQVFKTTKRNTGHVNTTRYFGCRLKNGYCRIYDKALESKLDSPLTRVEHTVEARSKLSFEKFCVRDEDAEKLPELSNMLSTIVDLALQVKSLGGDYSPSLSKLVRQTRYKIEPYLSGGFKEYEYDLDVLRNLLEYYAGLFHCSVSLHTDLVEWIAKDDDMPEWMKDDLAAYCPADSEFHSVPADMQIPFVQEKEG